MGWCCQAYSLPKLGILSNNGVTYRFWLTLKNSIGYIPILQMIFVSLISFNEANQIAHHNGGHGQVSNPEECFQNNCISENFCWLKATFENCLKESRTVKRHGRPMCKYWYWKYLPWKTFWFQLFLEQINLFYSTYIFVVFDHKIIWDKGSARKTLVNIH